MNFFATGNFLKHSTEGFPNEIFRHCETKNFRRKILILPPLSLIQTFSVPEINVTVKDSPTEIFGNVRQKISTENLDTPLPPPLLSINFFATGNFLKHSTEGFTYKIFRHCETKNFRWKIVILSPSPPPPPPLIHKLFRYRKISETQHRRVPLRNISVL